MSKGEMVYRETFDEGPGAWTQGKNRGDGSWHKNVLGQRGEGLPLEWRPNGGRTGGHVYTESPWYFDDNHGEFMWFHMPLTAQAELADEMGLGNDTVSSRIPTRDLRDAVLGMTLRGREMRLNGTRLIPWVQGWGGRRESLYLPGDALFCRGLTSQSVSGELLDGQWHKANFRLTDDEGSGAPAA